MFSWIFLGIFINVLEDFLSFILNLVNWREFSPSSRQFYHIHSPGSSRTTVPFRPDYTIFDCKLKTYFRIGETVIIYHNFSHAVKSLALIFWATEFSINVKKKVRIWMVLMDFPDFDRTLFIFYQQNKDINLYSRICDGRWFYSLH